MNSTKDLIGREDEVANKVLELGRNGAASYFGCNPSSFRDFLYRNSLPTKKAQVEKDDNKSTIKIKSDEAVIETKKQTEPLNDNEQIIKERGLNPEDWDFEGLVDSEWDSPNGEVLRARKLTLKRKNDIQGRLVLPARTDGNIWKAPKKREIDTSGSTFVCIADQQAPFHDPNLEEKQLALMNEIDVHTIINLGDTNDFPNISRFKSNPELEEVATVQLCINSGHKRLENQRACKPDARIIKLIGNHDVRLRTYQLNQAPLIFGLKRAELEGIEEAPVVSVENLMRLDELKVELVGEHASYEHGQFNLSPLLAARHGWIATKGAGMSALKTLDHLGYSILVAHTHRQGITHKTTFDINGESTVLAAAEIGASCRVDVTGLGFSPAPDWQQGGCTVTVWPDGKFHIDLMTYVNGELYWRDMRF